LCGSERLHPFDANASTNRRTNESQIVVKNDCDSSQKREAKNKRKEGKERVKKEHERRGALNKEAARQRA
jgi:hypothetical protein